MGTINVSLIERNVEVRGGLMVSVLDSVSSSAGLSPGRGHSNLIISTLFREGDT